MAFNPGSFLRAARSFLSLFSILNALPTQCLEILHRPSNTDTDSISFEKLRFLAAGKSGIVYGIDHKRVLKEFQESDGGEVERRAYQRLGSHPNIAKLLSTRKDGSIILERGEVLQTICRSPSANEIPIQSKLRWLRDAAEGYQYLHECNIIHGDVGCNNMILTRKGYLKIIDFEGCSIDGGPADSCYEWFSYRPTKLRVEQLYTNNRFPDVISLPLSRLIQSYWHGDLNSMSEVIQELEAFRSIHEN